QVRLTAALPRLPPAHRRPGRAGPDPDRPNDHGVGGGVRRPAPRAPQRPALGRRVPRFPPAPAVTAGGKCLLAFGLLLTMARGVVAQDSLIPVRRDAQVTSVGFRFAGNRSFSDGELGAQLAVKGRGSLYPVRRWLGNLPLIPSPSAYGFDPVELQKDVVRLRRFYQ